MVLTGKGLANASAIVAQLAELPKLTAVAFGERHCHAAESAFEHFGKGRHPAALNMGDCFAYAVASVAKAPLLFREGIGETALTPQAVNLILKHRCSLAGLDPSEFSAHGLRSGYLTEAARAGVALPEAMQQAQHRSVQRAASDYNDADRRLGKAVRLGG